MCIGVELMYAKGSKGMVKDFWVAHTENIKQLFKGSRDVILQRVGVVLLVAALILQFGVTFVEQQALAAGPDDMIPGGVKSKDEILAHYDYNTKHFRDVMNYNGITRAELSAMSATMKTYKMDSVRSWGWVSRFPGQGEIAHPVVGTTIYSRPMALWGDSYYSGWEGYSAARGTFRIQAACGNLLTWTVPQPSATCDSLVVAPVSRTQFKLTGKGSGKNGGVVKEMHYYAYDSAGKTVTAANGGAGATSTVTLDVAKAGAGTYRLQAYAISNIGNVTSAACTASVTVAEEQKPSIKVVKLVKNQKQAEVAVGEEFTYEIVVTNTGSIDLKDAVVTDTAPAQVALSKASEGAINSSKWTHTIALLKKGESKKYTITAKYEKYADGTHKNTVCVDTSTIPGGPDGCDEVTTKTKEDDMEVCDLKDNKVKRIKRSEFDAKYMTEDTTKCGEMKVCVVDTKELKTIPKKDYNKKTMTTDLSKCDKKPNTPDKPDKPNKPVTPPTPDKPTTPPTPDKPTTPPTPDKPVTPTPDKPATPTTSEPAAPATPTVVQLPQTGPVSLLSGLLGVGGLTTMSYAYVMSRRSMR